MRIAGEPPPVPERPAICAGQGEVDAISRRREHERGLVHAADEIAVLLLFEADGA